MDYGTRDKKQKKDSGREEEGLGVMSWWSEGGRGGGAVVVLGRGLWRRAGLRARHSVM